MNLESDWERVREEEIGPNIVFDKVLAGSKLRIDKELFNAFVLFFTSLDISPNSKWSLELVKELLSIVCP